MGRDAVATARALGDRALIAAAASALCLGETVAGHIAVARELREEARAEVDGLTDAELAPRLEALYYLGWAETYLEHYDEAVAHLERGMEITRTTGDGRLLVPMLLGKNYPFEMQGRLAEATECCQRALEAARLAASPHELYRALFELGWTLYFAGDLDGAIAAFEESLQFDRRLAGGTIPNGGGGPGWGLGVAWFDAGDVERGRKILLELVGEDVAAHDAGGALLRLGEPDARRAGGRAHRAGRRLRPPGRGGRSAARPAATRGAGRPRARRGVARGRRAGRGGTCGGAFGGGGSCGGRAAACGVLAQPAGARACGRRRARRGDRGAAPGRARARRRAARCASATRHAASCGGWEPGPRPADRRLQATAGSRH